MSDLSGKVQTVLGLIDPNELGHTQPHEHLLVNLIPPDQRDAGGEPISMENLGWLRRNWTSNTENLCLTSEADVIEEMKQYKDSGGGAIVDMTCIGIARDPQKLARISGETGVHLVMGTGYYTSLYHPPEVERLSENQLAEHMVREITEGVDNTGIKAGIIGEIGLDWPVHENEAKALRAAAKAQQKIGAALNVHPGRNEEAPIDAIRIVEQAGGDLKRTIVSHIDRTLFSFDAMVDLLETGCYIEWDLFGHESSFYPLAPIDMPNDATRIDYLLKLIKAGYRDRLLVSQDICTKTRLKKYGGEGYNHILENVLPMMERKGISGQDINALMVHNPARILTFP
jgi:phosphotriesterase-related protein